MSKATSRGPPPLNVWGFALADIIKDLTRDTTVVWGKALAKVIQDATDEDTVPEYTGESIHYNPLFPRPRYTGHSSTTIHDKELDAIHSVKTNKPIMNTADTMCDDINRELLKRYSAKILLSFLDSGRVTKDSVSVLSAEKSLPLCSVCHDDKQLRVNRVGGPNHTVLPTCKGVGGFPCCSLNLPMGGMVSLQVMLLPAQQRLFELTGEYPQTARYCILCVRNMIQTAIMVKRTAPFDTDLIDTQHFWNQAGAVQGYKLEHSHMPSVERGIHLSVAKFDPKMLQWKQDPVFGLHVDQSKIVFNEGDPVPEQHAIPPVADFH